jgi:hypothetical protein
MKKFGFTKLLTITATLSLVLSVAFLERGHAGETFSPYVDARGGITMPPDYRSRWVFLGTWSIDAGDKTAGAKGLHNVYTQPGVVEAYQSTGKFPDGTVLVKELLKSSTGKMTTGTISHATDTEGWFVMVKDTQNRFPDNKRWGDGWGWALFGTDGITKTKDYKAECLGCHIPAKGTGWVYTEGYPLLR